MFRVVIPARYGSTRLPGKLLAPLPEAGGRPMLQWVHAAGTASGAAQVIIATDDERILRTARGFGAEACMTSPEHPSGTDRIAEVAQAAGWREQDIIVNLQGDEPLMPPVLIGQVAGLLEQHPEADIATLATAVVSSRQLLDPGVVKVVTDAQGRALYFSRAPIPWNRDAQPAGAANAGSFAGARLHIGLYAYRVGALRRIARLAPGGLEQIECLEQLRALENGMEIRVADALTAPGPHVDTAEDLAHVREQIRLSEALPR